MKFIELTVHTTTEGSELVSDIFWNYTDYGVTICDVNDIVALQNDKRTFWDYMDDDLTAVQDSDVLVKCFLPADIADENIRSIVSDLNELGERGRGFVRLGSLETGRREIDGDDWIDVWKKHFRPIHIGKIVVCPEWIPYEPREGEQVVKLDSNMAFGTGEHETTSMCLELLQGAVKAGDTVIDVGCGSGILGIAAVKLGAAKAYLTDIDTVAVRSAEHNSELNGTADRTVIALSNLLDDAQIAGEVMTANITADILCALSESIPENLKEGGTLILSGIIESKLAQVVAAYEAKGLALQKQLRKGEWFALLFKR